MKSTRWMLLGASILIVVILLGTLPAAAQPGSPWLQVWFVPQDPGAVIEYRTATGQVAASYAIETAFGVTAQAGGRVFGSQFQAIPIFDPFQGRVVYDTLTGLGVDTNDLTYHVSNPVPTRDGQAYYYAITPMSSDFGASSTSFIYRMTVGGGQATLVYQETLADGFMTLQPFGVLDDGRVMLYEQPVGIGGYILFWTYSGVRIFDPQTQSMTPVAETDGFASTGALFAQVSAFNATPAVQLFAPGGAAISIPVMGLPESPGTGGDVVFSPSNTRAAFQMARQDPENETFWTVVVDVASGTARVVLQDDATGYDLRYGYIGGWLDDNTLVVGDAWTGHSAVVDVTTGQLLREERGAFLGYAQGVADTSQFAASGAAAAQCPGAPVSRLAINQSGRVTFSNGVPVNVRLSPGGERIGTQPEGARFIVMDGPVCSGGYAWWHVQFEAGMAGYVAEGEAGNYFLEPWK